MVTVELDGVEEHEMGQFIYIASIPSMPGVVKIGKSSRAPNESLKALDPFGVEQVCYREFSAEVVSASISESRIQVKLSRAGFKELGSGLFRISIVEAIKVTISLIDNYKVVFCRKDIEIDDLIKSSGPAEEVSKDQGRYKLRDRRRLQYNNPPSLVGENAKYDVGSAHGLPDSKAKEQLYPASQKFGYIYVISNPSMPGYIKVGRTDTTPEKRLSDLHSTGVPSQFELELALEVENSVKSEKQAHIVLAKFRPEKNREFFKISVKSAIELILPAIGDYRIYKLREDFGIEVLINQVEAKRRLADKKRYEKISQIELELRQLCEEAESLEQALRVERVRYESLGSYPDNPFGGFFALAVILAPVVLIVFSTLGVSAETALMLIALVMAFMGAINYGLEKEVGERVVPFDESRRKIDKVEAELKPIKEKIREREMDIKYLNVKP